VDGAVSPTASAPARLDFAGGWTDVPPFADERGGVVVNAAIELRAFAAVEPAPGYEICSDDLGLTLHPQGRADLEPSGELALLKAALRLSDLGPCRLHTRSEAPPGSGLGSSGALDVALIAALDAARAIGAGERGGPPPWSPLPSPDLAARAWQLEAVEASLPGGKQDQYAAALGGFHRFGFDASGVTIERLELDAGFRSALADHLLVCYTGQSRVSSATIERVMAAYRAGDPRITAALQGLVDVAGRMADALRAADLARVGALLSENWRLQQELDPGMCTERMAQLQRHLEPVGLLGGKAAGAGAGGSMFFLVAGSLDRARSIAAGCGATVLPVRWADQGVRVW
jgi:D-glycero-alpha-D-manno-heptose-7-phosphate kinase